jgi:hypothetical protein
VDRRRDERDERHATGRAPRWPPASPSSSPR